MLVLDHATSFNCLHAVLKDPFANWDHEPCFLRNRNKLRTKNKAIFRVLPTDQGFHPLNLITVQDPPAADRRGRAHFFSVHNANGSPKRDDPNAFPSMHARVHWKRNMLL